VVLLLTFNRLRSLRMLRDISLGHPCLLLIHSPSEARDYVLGLTVGAVYDRPGGNLNVRKEDYNGDRISITFRVRLAPPPSRQIVMRPDRAGYLPRRAELASAV
jgi:hypothetical protein